MNPKCTARCVVSGTHVYVVLILDGWHTGDVLEMELRRARTFASWGRIGNMLCTMRRTAVQRLSRGVARGWRVT